MRPKPSEQLLGEAICRKGLGDCEGKNNADKTPETEAAKAHNPTGKLFELVGPTAKKVVRKMQKALESLD